MRERVYKCVHVVYDGIHYDCLAAAPQSSSPESSDVTIFSPGDSLIEGKARYLASEAQKVRTRCACCSAFALDGRSWRMAAMEKQEVF